MANFTTLDKGWGSGTPKLKLLPNFGISIGAYPLHDYLQNFQHFGECHDWLTGKISDPVKCQRGFTVVGVFASGVHFPQFFCTRSGKIRFGGARTVCSSYRWNFVCRQGKSVIFPLRHLLF